MDVAGRGGMGVVYRARDEQTGATVAMKVVSAEEEATAVRFKREARALAAITHPSVVRYHDYGTADASLYMVMDWIEGEDLRSRLQRGPLTIREALELVIDVAGALAAMHANGLVHRDIKPANLLLMDGRADQPRIVDFGVVRLGLDATRVTGVGYLVGTPGYSAPEQVRGDEAIDGRADVFALGAVLYHCLTGRRPFVGESVVAVLGKVLFDDVPAVSSLNALVSAELDALVALMLSKRIADRPDAESVKIAATHHHSMLERATEIPETRPNAPVTHAERRLASVVVVSQRDVDGRTTVRFVRGAGNPVRATIEAHGGQMAQLADGTVLAEFSAQSGGHQAERAARCALALHARKIPGEVIVVSTGLVDVNDAHLPVGEALDRAGVILRDAISAPATANGEPIRIDDVTVGLLQSTFEVERVGAFAHLLRRLDDVSSQSERKHRTPFVGRDQEIAWLGSMLAESIDDGVVRVAVLSGAAGSGKTRVREEFLTRARREHPMLAIHLVRCDASTSSSAFTLARGILAHSLDVREGEPESVRKHKLDAALRGSVVREGSALFLAELLGAAAGSDAAIHAARVDPILMGDRIRGAWEDWLAFACERAPTLIVIEDAQHADPPSMGLLDRAMRALGKARLAVVATARPEISERFSNLWEQHSPQWIRLRDLSRRASEQIVALAGIDGGAVQALIDRAGGNAMVLEELVAAHVRGQRDAFPETLLALVHARLATLDGESRRVLRAASVMGVVFHRSAVHALVGATQEIVEEQLRVLELRGFIVGRRASIAGEHEYAFAQPVVREAAYATLPKEERERAHGVAANWLMRVGVRDGALLADHLERAARFDEAISRFRAAAEAALAGDDFAAAIGFADRGVALAKGHARGELHAVASDALWWRGDAKLALDRFKLAVADLRLGSAAYFNVSGGLAGAAFATSATSDALAVVNAALAAEPEDVAAHEAKFSALARSTYGTLLAGHVPVARDLLAWLTPNESRLAANAHVARARLLQSRALWESIEGDLALFIPLTRAAQEHLRAIGDMRNVHWQQGNLGAALVEMGAYAEAVETLETLLAAIDVSNAPSVVDIAKNNLGLALGRLGRLDEGLLIERQAVAAFAARGHARMEGASRAYVAEMLWRKGELADAASEAELATKLLGEAPLGHYASAIASRVEMSLGHADKALELALRAAKPVMQGSSIDEGESFVRLSFVEALRASGDEVAARYAGQAAREFVLRRASRIHDMRYREIFLAEPINAQILAR